MNIKRTTNNYNLSYIKSVSSKFIVLKLTNTIFIFLIIKKLKNKIFHLKVYLKIITLLKKKNIRIIKTLFNYSIFDFSSILHLATTIVIQYFLMRDLEKLTGSLRIALIYLGSGVAGNLGSAIFVPYRADVSKFILLFKII